METTISSKGQIVLPADLRRQDDVQAGQAFAIERIEAGEYLLKRLPAGDATGFTDWLLACPYQDWFQPLSSESTDTL